MYSLFYERKKLRGTEKTKKTKKKREKRPSEILLESERIEKKTTQSKRFLKQQQIQKKRFRTFKAFKTSQITALQNSLDNLKIEHDVTRSFGGCPFEKQ